MEEGERHIRVIDRVADTGEAWQWMQSPLPAPPSPSRSSKGHPHSASAPSAVWQQAALDTL